MGNPINTHPKAKTSRGIFMGRLSQMLAIGLMLAVLCHAQVPVPVLWDDDATSDVDTASTAAAIHKLMDQNVVKIVGITADTANVDAAPALFIFARYYQHTSAQGVYFGAYQGSLNTCITPATGCNTSGWNAALVAQYNAGDTRANYESCATTWRRAAAQNPGLVIIMSGTPECEALFLASGADSISPLTGVQLAKQNVSKLVILGGINPSGAGSCSATQPEFNFATDPAAWNSLFTTWTSQNGYPPVWMVDFCDGLITSSGPPTYATNTINPVLYAFNQDGVNQRNVWDSLTVLLGAYGLGPPNGIYFADSGNGTQTVNATTAVNSWGTGTASGQHYVTNVASASVFANLLDGFSHPFGYAALGPLVGTGGGLIGPVSFNGISLKADNITSVTVGNNVEAQPGGCSNSSTCLISAFPISHAGSAIYVRVAWCGDASCNTVTPANPTVADSCGNTYTRQTSHLQIAWSQAVFTAPDASIGTCNITVTAGSAQTLFYMRYLAVEGINANKVNPVDIGMTATANGSGTAASITSAGSAVVAGELVIADYDVTNPVNTGVCSTLQTDNANFMEVTAAPAISAPVTCALTQSSASWWSTLVALKP